MNTKSSQDVPCLKDLVTRAYIVKYREDTTELEESLKNAGFECFLIKKDYSDEELKFSSISRGLITHAKAWTRIVEDDKPALVVEADFVPCLGIEKFPLPHHRPDDVWCWLYTGTSVAYELEEGKFMRGHAASPVATLIYPKLARLLIKFSLLEISTKNPQEYLPWDSYVDYYIRGFGWKVYLAYRSYGEHGGKPDPAHKNFGLRKTHRADCLYSELAFLPSYAEGSTVSFVLERIIAKLKAVAKIVALRRIDKNSFYSLVKHPDKFMKFFHYEFKRLLTIY